MLAVDAYFLEFSGNSACGWVVDDAFSWNNAIAEGQIHPSSSHDQAKSGLQRKSKLPSIGDALEALVACHLIGRNCYTEYVWLSTLLVGKLLCRVNNQIS